MKNRKIFVSLLGLLILGFCMLSAWAGDKRPEDCSGQQFHSQTNLPQDYFKKQKCPKPPNPPRYKRYTEAKMVKLPEPKYRGKVLEEAIERRRSVRNYSSKAITQAQLSQLLFAAQGITDQIDGHALRAAPSAGALYPFEVYVIVNNVKNLTRGIYHYAVLEHVLELIEEGDFRKKIINAGLGQDILGKAGVTFVLSAVFDRTRSKYGERGYRYIYMEAGHISQNIYLQAVSLGLGSVGVAAFFDEKVNKLIGVDGQKESVVYLHPVGAL